jgi:vacuolar-type H+-ATPase catalytic subunit A/Vma1
MATKQAPDMRVTGLFDQAIQTFGDALKAGVKVHEELGKFWTEAIDQSAPVNEWQKRARTVVHDAIPAAQRNAEEWIKLVEANYRRSMNLLKKAFDSEQDTSDLRIKTQKLWEESLDLIRDNAQAMAQANVKMMEMWAGVTKKNAEAVRATVK